VPGPEFKPQYKQMKNKLLNQDPKLHQTSEKLKHLALVPII
jgi:hypothetical protein